MLKPLMCATLCFLGTIAYAKAEPNASNERAIALGKSIALRAQAELGKNLMQSISTNGTVAAVEFCSEQALPITAKVSAELGASIKRVSDQPRNPKNSANASELAYIADAKASLAKGMAPTPALHTANGKTEGYYPITTNGLCLQCHGSASSDVAAETLAAITAIYPEDQALGYGVNELRGIWVIALPTTDEKR